jgi:hypothetical protein
VGGALGLAILATVSIDAMRAKLTALHATTPAAQAVATTHGYTTAFVWAAVLAGLGLVVSLLVIRVPTVMAGDEELASSALLG